MFHPPFSTLFASDRGESRAFDAGDPDGLPGIKTQAAIRDYQLSQQLPADGYAGPSVFHRLTGE